MREHAAAHGFSEILSAAIKAPLITSIPVTAPPAGRNNALSSDWLLSLFEGPVFVSQAQYRREEYQGSNVRRREM
jgi:hypothetical protein